MYQRNKFKSDPDKYDSHCLNLPKGLNFPFVKEDNNKASFDTNLEAYIQFKDCRNIISIPKDRDHHGWWKKWRFQGKICFEGLSNKVENHPARILKCFGHGIFSGFPIEMTNVIPTKLLAVMVTTQNYYYKPPIVQSHLKNILVEKNKKCGKPTDAKYVFKKAVNKLVHKKKKYGKYHVWDTIPHSPPVKVIHLDSIGGFCHDIPLKNSLKEMTECYNVCKEDLDKENTIIQLHHSAKLEKLRQHNFNWVLNNVGLNNQKKHPSVLDDSSLECSYSLSSNKRKVSLSPDNVGTSVEEIDGLGED
jgi:hypothetical protein